MKCDFHADVFSTVTNHGFSSNIGLRVSGNTSTVLQQSLKSFVEALREAAQAKGEDGRLTSRRFVSFNCY